MEISITEASKDDLEEVREFFNEFFALRLEGISLRPHGLTEIETGGYLPDSATDLDRCCLTARADGKVVGLLSFCRYAKIEYRHCGDFGMALLPEYWQRGIGSLLLDKLETWCNRQSNIVKIELSVWGNNNRAIHLYTRHGYEQEGCRKGSIIRDGNSIDLVLMGKFL